MRFLDTSNEYGDGEVERRVGEAIRERGGLPEGFVLETKVDPDPVTGDFSGARRASVEESLDRLGLDHLALLHLHDPERISFEDGMAAGGPVEALIQLRKEGIVDSIGVAGGPIELLIRYVATDVFDAVLTHNRYTLLDRSAEPLLAEATDRGMGFLNAAPYGGGMLASRSRRPAALRLRPPGRLARRQRPRDGSPPAIGTACHSAAAALQFSVREPRIYATVVGMSAPERVQETLDLLDVVISEAALGPAEAAHPAAGTMDRLEAQPLLDHIVGGRHEADARRHGAATAQSAASSNWPIGVSVTWRRSVPSARTT